MFRCSVQFPEAEPQQSFYRHLFHRFWWENLIFQSDFISDVTDANCTDLAQHLRVFYTIITLLLLCYYCIIDAPERVSVVSSPLRQPGPLNLSPQPQKVFVVTVMTVQCLQLPPTPPTTTTTTSVCFSWRECSKKAKGHSQSAAPSIADNLSASSASICTNKQRGWSITPTFDGRKSAEAHYRLPLRLNFAISWGHAPPQRPDNHCPPRPPWSVAMCPAWWQARLINEQWAALLVSPLVSKQQGIWLTAQRLLIGSSWLVASPERGDAANTCFTPRGQCGSRGGGGQQGGTFPRGTFRKIWKRQDDQSTSHRKITTNSCFHEQRCQKSERRMLPAGLDNVILEF